MLPNLPKWYQIATVHPYDAETLEKRSTAIEAIVASKDFQFISDCIRLYLNIPNKRSGDFKNEFYLSFNSTDPMFLADGNAIEKQVLAGAILFEAINKNSSDSIKIAASIKTGVFGLSKESIINIDIIQSAIEYLQNQAIFIREIEEYKSTFPKFPSLSVDAAPTLESLATQIKGLSPYLKSIAAAIEKQDKAFTGKIEILEEESNIHWWLFRSFSEMKNISVSELDQFEAPFILAMELSRLYKKFPLPNNSQAFLNKILNDVSKLPDNISIKQAVDVIYRIFGNDFKEGSTEFNNLTPLYFGCSKSIEVVGNDAWTTAFEVQASQKVSFSCTPQEISLQFLLETFLNDFNH